MATRWSPPWRLHLNMYWCNTQGPSGEVDVRSIRSYLINPVSGLGAFIGDTLPIIKAFHENGYIAVLQDPFLRLEARRFTTGR